MILACEHCHFHQPERHTDFGKCNHPKVDQSFAYCNVERQDFATATTCGPYGKLFEPKPEHFLEYATTEEYQFSRNPFAFWLDPSRWDNINPSLRDPDGQAFWMR